MTPPTSVPPASPSSPTVHGTDGKDDDTESLLRNYFALSLSLSSLYSQWAASDSNFARRALAFTGIRILNQDAWEALVAFICSSNNNISRISQMVHKLCLHYGPYVGTIQGEAFHDFPGPDVLSGTQVEAHLRQLGFGYRARYIAETAAKISTQKPASYLLQLRNPNSPPLSNTTATPPIKSEEEKEETDPPTYRAAHTALLDLPGVGPKVADCVCLMGLGWGEAVPVDTHVWQIAQRDYKFGSKGAKTKTFTKAMYDAVGDHFRAIWGAQAGWAQSVLFTANLRSFADQAKGGGGGGEASEEVVTSGAAVVADAVKVKKAAVWKLKSEDETVGHGAAVVKVEEVQVVHAAAAGRRVRKRKASTEMPACEVGGQPGETETTHVEVYTRRTSKRIKAMGA